MDTSGFLEITFNYKRLILMCTLESGNPGRQSDQNLRCSTGEGLGP